MKYNRKENTFHTLLLLKWLLLQIFSLSNLWENERSEDIRLELLDDLFSGRLFLGLWGKEHSRVVDYHIQALIGNYAFDL